MAGNNVVFVFPCSPPVGTITVLANLVARLLLPLWPYCSLLSPEAKRWENVKEGVMPNHRKGIDCHSTWFWDAMKHICLFIYSWSKKINIWFSKFLNNTFKMFRIKLPFCGIIQNSGLLISNCIIFSGMWGADIQNLFLIADSHISITILLQVMDFIPPMLLINLWPLRCHT